MAALSAVQQGFARKDSQAAAGVGELVLGCDRGRLRHHDLAILIQHDIHTLLADVREPEGAALVRVMPHDHLKVLADLAAAEMVGVQRAQVCTLPSVPDANLVTGTLQSSHWGHPNPDVSISINRHS